MTYCFVILARQEDIPMQSKLTLRLDDSLIKQAKVFAKQHDKSLSQVVSDYFQHLTKDQDSLEVPALTKSLVGILKNSDVTQDDYKKHLADKYL